MICKIKLMCQLFRSKMVSAEHFPRYACELADARKITDASNIQQYNLNLNIELNHHKIHLEFDS